jgi:hypothetical protein
MRVCRRVGILDDDGVSLVEAVSLMSRKEKRVLEVVDGDSVTK